MERLRRGAESEMSNNMGIYVTSPREVYRGRNVERNKRGKTE
jgi:hypothetical protein